MNLFRQTRTLGDKTLRIVLTKHLKTTIYSALVLPIIASVYLGIGQNLTNPNSKFGIGKPYDIRSLEDALSAAGGGRDTVAFVDSGFTGGDIESVISSLSDIVTGAGKNATTISDESDLGYVCRSSYRGTSNCFGAVVFGSSPDEGDAGYWNYTLRGDGALGTRFKVDEDKNDAQIYALPLQRAVDQAIVKLGSDNDDALSDTAQAYAFTAQTEAERKAELQRDYQSAFINYLSVAFLLALIGVCYHMPGLIATEREKGLSQLIDAMMPARYAYERQAARMLSHHYAFSLAYFPGWIVAAVIVRSMIWDNTSYGIVIPFFILAGLAITSMSLLGAAFFNRAQLSGAVTSVVWIVLGIVAQVLSNPPTGAVAVLSILFTPCNFVFFIVYIARYEAEGEATDLLKSPPGSNSSLPGIVHWIFLIIQILVYPFLAAVLERTLHGVSARNSFQGQTDSGDAVRLQGMTKIFKPSLLRRLFALVSPPRPEVVAVSNLSLSAKKGQILALLGANGSGKSTTLDAIAGISNFTSGEISIDTSGGLGIAPQKNVLWDELTVKDHIKLFNKIKSPQNPSSDEEIIDLIEAIGLGSKLNARSTTLSGGQKRKLQLGMMLTGGSAICCVDEVSSGIDPLSRRKIWDILLSERGSRTIIMTTHFLDEADLLADDIAILSKGTLRAEGSSAELKDRLGAGYRVHVLDPKTVKNTPDIDGVSKKVTHSSITYVSPSSGLAAEVIRALEAASIRYEFSGPTIEDVFLNVAEEVRGEDDVEHRPTLPTVSKERSEDSQATRVPGNGRDSQDLLTGRQTGFVKQTGVLIRKRFTVFKTNWLPYLAAFAIPIIAAGVTQLLVKDQKLSGCKPGDQSTAAKITDFTDLFEMSYIVSGPSSDFDSGLGDLFKAFVPDGSPLDGSSSSNLTLVDSFDSFRSSIEDHREDVSPAGWWLGSSGSPATLAFKADRLSMYTAIIGQNFMNVMLTNKTISTSYTSFDSPVSSSTGDALQLAVYLGLAVSIFPGLFGLYVNTERRNNVRSLQYSSGARSLPLWTAHLSFDFAIILLSMCITAAIYIGTSDIWYNGGYLFPVFILYGLASLMLSYLISLWMGSSLSTFAANTALQGVGFAVYLIAFLFILTYSDASAVDKNILISHWVISIFFPTGSLLRAMLVGLNAFSAACDGYDLQSYPGAITAYGGPILYLAVQCVIYFAILIWVDSGSFAKLGRDKVAPTDEADDPEVAKELVRVDGYGDNQEGLRAAHLTKSFGNFTAVDNVTFGIEHGEVFALLGPNGAGKSTTISMIRGDLLPSKNGGDVFIEGTSITTDRAAARVNLGVCPQFDAIDSMTVREHLEFYARLRGISNVEQQVQAVVRAVGLEQYTNRMAHTLSGGNKRKLSLGIALTGNPSVIILDEPSSGLDAAAKRIMWKTLETIVPGRSILLTTHSMEEADALATRAGIIAKRMLALGTPENLRRRFGDTLHVHLVSKSAPHSPPEEMQNVSNWVLNKFPGAEMEQGTYHGQMRFSIPSESVLEVTGSNSGSPIGQLLVILEENKEALNIAHHSVSPTKLEQVFLSIVGKHDVQEEGYRAEEESGKKHRKGANKPWYLRNIWEFGRDDFKRNKNDNKMDVTLDNGSSHSASPMSGANGFQPHSQPAPSLAPPQATAAPMPLRNNQLDVGLAPQQVPGTPPGVFRNQGYERRTEVQGGSPEAEPELTEKEKKKKKIKSDKPWYLKNIWEFF